VQHAILYGEHELTLDDKNRLLVPAEIRKALDPQRDGEAFFMVVGTNRKLWFYPENYYGLLVAQRQQDITPDEDILAFDQMHFARASKVEWDKQGRVVIPERALRRTELGREVTLIGVRDHLELWNRTDWSQREAELDQKQSEIALRARQARTTQQ
jgi:MraZ protein